MRPISVFFALAVAAALYALVFERDAAMRLAGGSSGPVVAADGAALPEDAPAESRADDGRKSVSVMALRSQARTIDGAVLLRGRTEADRQVEVRSETSGRIVSAPLRKGSFVEAGQLLCQLDPGTREASLAEAEARLVEAGARRPEAEARLAEAQALLREAEINNNAAARLSEDGFATATRVASSEAAVESALAAVQSARSQIDGAASGVQAAAAAVAAARTEIARLAILAPFGGLLESDTAELGALLQPGDLCATVIQLDPIKLVGFVPETDVGKVEVGAPAQARLASGETVAGRVRFLSRASDAETRTFRAEVEVPNPDLAIRDGQTVEIVIASEGRQAHLLPQSAMTLNDDGALGVRLVGDEDRARFAPIELLRDTVDGVWVAGLDPQIAVIVVGQEYVTDGTPVAPTYREKDETEAPGTIDDRTAAPQGAEEQGADAAKTGATVPGRRRTDAPDASDAAVTDTATDSTTTTVAITEADQ